MKNFIVGAIVIGIIMTLGLVVNNSTKLGASSGPDHLNREYFYGGLVQGGGIKTVTTGTTVTWTAKEVCENSVIKWVPTASSILSTTTLPTAATLISECLAKDGDFKDIIFWNNGALATNTVGFTVGSGNTVHIPEATGADKVIEGLNLARIRFLRTSSTAVRVFIDEELVQ